MKFTADFETTTDPEDCRVWVAGLCEIGNPDNFFWFKNITQLMVWLFKEKSNHTLYFHNLKFDGEFIIDWLFRNGFTHVISKEEASSKTFTTLIADKGPFYMMTIYFTVSEKYTKKVTIIDSLKILNFSVKQIAQAFNLPEGKGEIDYSKNREVDYIPTEEEIDYLRRDVQIVAQALHILFEQGLTKMTQGSNALFDFKNIMGKDNFDKLFPVPDYDSDIRESYKGGFTYLSPKFKNKDVGEGIVLDVNSLYPSVMYYEKLPYGEGKPFGGKYRKDSEYDLYIQSFSCTFEIKEGYIPTRQIKNSYLFSETEYLTSSDGHEVFMCMTNIDLDLFFDHYNVYNVEWIGGWKFKSMTGLFKDYIDKWSSVKIESKKSGNKAMYTLAKLMLNALYGKFALNPRTRSKIPYFDEEEDRVKYKFGEYEDREPIYLPVGTFITAHARNKTIRSAQAVYDRFIYADTDSLHLLGKEIPEMLDVDSVRLGAWDYESHFKRARFICQKRYFEVEYKDKSLLKNAFVKDNIIYDNETKAEKGFIEDGDILSNKITCAGMPSSCYPQVTWDNFKPGAHFDDKLTMKRVKGGIVLVDNGFTLKG